MAKEKKEKICGIYKIENLVNGKVYIGQSIDIFRRWREHKDELNNNRKKNIHLQSAWNIDGSINFIFEILIECNIEQLDKNEVYWINYYKSTNENCGYNMVSGGNFRKIIPEELKEKLRLLQTNNRPIFQIDLSGNIINEWFGAREASKKLNISQSSILNCLKGRRKTSKNNIWIYKDKFNKDGINLDNYISKTPILKITQMNLNLEIIKEWNNALDINKLLGYNSSAVHKSCKGLIPISNGFVWMYSKDINELNIANRKIEVAKIRKRYICLIDDFGNIIKKYKNSKECSKDLKIDQGAIIKICDKKRKKVKNFQFIYGELVV